MTVLGLLFTVAGVVGLFYHVTQEKLSSGLVLILALRAAAVVGGVFLLLGQNWARWLTVSWLALHVAISAFHSTEQMAAHGVLLAVVAYFLFKKPESNYFRPTAAG